MNETTHIRVTKAVQKALSSQSRQLSAKLDRRITISETIEIALALLNDNN